jgi:tetratricopeptide (TPR) repeat protein
MIPSILLIAVLSSVAPASASIQSDQPPTAISVDEAMTKVDRLIDESRPLFMAQRYSEAVELCEKALAISERDLGEGPYTAMILTNLGLNYASIGQYGQAEKAYLHALAIEERVYGLDATRSATLLRNIGLLYRNTDRGSQAEPFLARADAIEARTKTSLPAH